MKPKSNKYFNALMKALPPMEGWVREESTDDFYGQKGLISTRKVMLTSLSLSAKIEIIAYEIRRGEKIDEWCFVAGGHVKFTKNPGEPLNGVLFSLDRIGVEDSFYLAATDTLEIFQRTLAQQVERVERQRTYWKTAVSIPDIPFTVAPDGVDKLKARIKKGEPVHFTPSGFGTGYILSTYSSRYAKAGSKALATFLGVPRVFITTFDAD